MFLESVKKGSARSNVLCLRSGTFLQVFCIKTRFRESSTERKNVAVFRYKTFHIYDFFNFKAKFEFSKRV